MRWALAGVAVLVALVVAGMTASNIGDNDGDGDAAITVQGEAPARTNIPTASDPDASGGELLALDTVDDPPSDGWYATYEVDAPADGVYQLEAVATPPMEQPHSPEYGSFFNLSVNDGPFAEVAGSQTSWVVSPVAWGSLSSLSLPDVELERGTNTVTFMVDERTVSTDHPSFRFFLDELTFTPTDVGVAAVYTGDPSTELGIKEAGETVDLHIELNGRAAGAQVVTYLVTGYFGDEVAEGTATIREGDTTTIVALTDLAPGNYRATAALESSPDATTVGYFAQLPEGQAVSGPANRFGVNTYVLASVPPSRLGPFIGAMKAMGAGYVREGNPTPADPESEVGSDLFGRTVDRFHDHDIETLEFVGPAPNWDITEASVPLPVDLRDAYSSANEAAASADGTRSDAVQLWNEPDVDDTNSTGDQHAAYTKAAALGVADAGDPPLVVLSGIAGEENFQELMLRNDVARYADVWSFHSYPDPAEQQDPEFSGSDEQHELRRLHGAETSMWATESGVLLEAQPDGDLAVEQQAIQARYLVQSTIEDLAAGTDRHFWFGGPPSVLYYDDVKEPDDDGFQFGVFNRDFQPWPAYSAHAAMASILGEANFVDQSIDMESYTARFEFDTGEQAVNVVWAGAPTEVDVPVPGTTVDVYDIMGRHQETVDVSADGTIGVGASSDPVYLVSDAPPEGDARPSPDDEVRTEPPSTSERIVLSQRYDTENAPPSKDHGDAEPPLGYQLDGTTPMALDVYNFNDTPQTVTLAAQAYGGWSVEPAEQDTVEVEPMGMVSVPFTVTADDDVVPRVDYPLVFEGSVDDDAVPPSVSKIQLATSDEPGDPVSLAPVIEDVTPGHDSTVTGPLELEARITDDLAGIDPARVEIEVDGEPAESQFDTETGQLTATLELQPGRHDVWIRAYNRAYAPAHVAFDVEVRR